MAAAGQTDRQTDRQTVLYSIVFCHTRMHLDRAGAGHDIRQRHKKGNNDLLEKGYVEVTYSQVYNTAS